MSDPLSLPPNRTQPPPSGPERPLRLPEVRRELLPSGLALVAVRDPSVPLVSASLLVRGGSSIDPEGGEGLASLTAALLTEGSLSCDGPAFAKRVDRLGASLSAAAGPDSTGVGLTILSRFFEEGLELLGEAALSPAFAERDVRRVRGIRLDSLRQRRDSPGALASIAFDELVFAGTRYSHPVAGYPASVAPLDVADLAAFHEGKFRPEGGALVATGDLDPDSFFKEASRIFGGWNGGAPPLPSIGMKSQDRGTTIRLVDRPASVQSSLRVGGPAVTRSHPDFHLLEVLNAILGGKFVSRINLNLRERHGYTYGASSRFAYRVAAGAFVVSVDVQNDATAPALSELISELERIRQGLVEPGELEDAVRYLTGVFPYMLETADDLASRLLDIHLHRLPTDFLETYREKISSSTSEAILEAARRHLDPSNLSIVVVGRAEEAAAPLERIAPVEVVDVDGEGRGREGAIGTLAEWGGVEQS
jgi:zinc protease